MTRAVAALAAVLALLAAVLLGLRTWQQHERAVGAAALQPALAAANARADAAALAMHRDRVRAELSAQEADRAHTDLSRATADAAGARAAADRLRDWAAAYAAGGRADDTQPAGASAATTGPGLVLADMLGRCAQAVADYAAEADARGIAGAACERIHDGLSREANGTP